MIPADLRGKISSDRQVRRLKFLRERRPTAYVDALHALIRESLEMIDHLIPSVDDRSSLKENQP